MKKFFALFMVSALLAFAGSAFAADPTITADPASVTVAAGDTATATVTGTAANGGTLAYTVSGDISWATISGTTVTLAPEATVVPGSYTVTVTVTETYSVDDTGGHGTPTTYTATANTIIAVTVTPPKLTPTITASPATVTARPGGTYEATVTGTATTGVEDSTLAFSKVSGPDWATLTPANDGTTATVTFRPGPDVEAGSDNVVIRVTETAASRTEGTADVTITVTVEGEPIPIPTPAITPSTETASVTVGQSGSVTVTGTASQGGTLTYSVSGPSWVTIDSATGALTISPTTDVEAGDYDVTVTVTETVDGNPGTASTTIKVTVEAPVFEPEVTVSPEGTLSVIAGASVTATVTAEPALDGTLEFSVSGAEWATITPANDGLTAVLTLAPNASVDAGSYTVVVTVTETSGLYTGDATVSIPVNVSAYVPPASDDPAEEINKTQVSEIVSKIEIVVKSIFTVGRNFIDRVATQVTGVTIQMSIKVTVSESLTNGDYGVTPVEAQAAQEAQEETVNNLIGTTFADRGDNVETVDNSDVDMDVDEDTTEEDHLNNASEILSQLDDAEGSNKRSGYVPLMGSMKIKPKKSGVVTVPTPQFKEDARGKHIRGDNVKGKKGTAAYGASTGVFASAAGATAEDIIFLNSAGVSVDVVPGDDDPDVIPGFVSMVMYVEADTEYQPIISILNEDLPEDVQAATEEKEVEVIRVQPSTFVAQSNSFFSTMVSWDLIESTDMTGGYTYYRISDDAAGRVNSVIVGEDWTRTDEESLALVSNPDYNLERIVRLPSLSAVNETEDNVYVVKVNFKISDDRRADIIASADNGAFEFFPDGPTKASARSRLRKLENGHLVVMAPEDLKDTTLTEGYLAFIIPAGATLSRPMLAVRVVKPAAPEDFQFTVSKTNVTVKLGETETASITPVNNSGDVTYEAYEGTTELSWITFNNNAVTFAPTASTATAKAYSVTITGTDEADEEYSAHISVTVTEDTEPGPEPGPGPSGSLSLGASSSALSLTVGQTESVTLTATGLQGEATYTYDADLAAGVELTDSTTSTATATFTPLAAGTYNVVFTVRDAGRTSDNTASTTVVLTVTAGSKPGKSSGGGCSAGFSAMALAVLGAFIARRKK